MANNTGTPQSMLYQMRGQSTAPSDGNGSRNRSVEQQHSYNSGNPMNYTQFLNGQDPSLGRYTPPTLQGTSPTNQRWNNNQGGYAYNLPTAFGGFSGFSQYSQPPQGGWGSGSGFGGGPTQGQSQMGYNMAAALSSGSGFGGAVPQSKPMQMQGQPKPMPMMPPTMPPQGGNRSDMTYKQLVGMLQNSARIPRLSMQNPIGSTMPLANDNM